MGLNPFLGVPHLLQTRSCSWACTRGGGGGPPHAGQASGSASTAARRPTAWPLSPVGAPEGPRAQRTAQEGLLAWAASPGDRRIVPMPTLTPDQRRQGSSGFRFPSRCNSNFSLTTEILGLYNSSLHCNLLSQTSKLTLKTKCFNARHPTAHVDSSPLLSDFKTLSPFYFLKTVQTTKLENKKVGLKITVRLFVLKPSSLTGWLVFPLEHISVF